MFYCRAGFWFLINPKSQRSWLPLGKSVDFHTLWYTVNVLFCYLIRQRTSVQTLGIMWTKIGSENVSGHFATMKEDSTLSRWKLDFLFLEISWTFLAQNLSMPTLQLFMLEAKCFTLHWRRQNRVILMLPFYASDENVPCLGLRQIHIYKYFVGFFFPPWNMCINQFPGRWTFILGEALSKWRSLTGKCLCRMLPIYLTARYRG